MNLVVDGQVVSPTTGQNSEQLKWTNWDVSALKGTTAHIDLVDQKVGWGHILVDVDVP